jgi:hypothetical protein
MAKAINENNVESMKSMKEIKMAYRKKYRGESGNNQ